MNYRRFFVDNKQLILGFLILLAACFSYWQIIRTSKTSPMAEKKLSHHPDSFMKQVVARRIDKEGKLKGQLLSPEMIHYPDDDSVDVTTPRMLVSSQLAPTLVAPRQSLKRLISGMMSSSDNPLSIQNKMSL